MVEAARKYLNPTRQRTTIRQNPEPSLYVSLPFHPSLSKPIKKILGQHDIKVTHKDEDYSPSLSHP